MDFSEALSLMKQGKKVRRKGYVENNNVFYIKHGNIWRTVSSGEDIVEYLISESLLSNDWEEVVE